MYVLLSVDGQYWENSSLMYWMMIPPLQDFTPSPVFNSTLLCLYSLLVGTGMAWTFGCISNRPLAIWVATESFNWVGSRIVKTSKLHRHSRQIDSTNNSTEAKPTEETMLKINKLLSEARVFLCQSKFLWIMNAEISFPESTLHPAHAQCSFYKSRLSLWK